jgi:hypothetical protein
MNKMDSPRLTNGTERIGNNIQFLSNPLTHTKLGNNMIFVFDKFDRYITNSNIIKVIHIKKTLKV